MKPRVLLVEDDPTTRAFLHMATQALDVEIDLAASMQQALALAAQTRYAAWLLDARLPDGSGVDLLERLRQTHPETPALAHTATPDQAQLQGLRDVGFDAVVSKPLPAADWQAAVCALLPSQVQPAIALWDDAAALKVLGEHPDELTALRRLFVRELPEQIKTLERAHTDQDGSTIQSELHRLRASCSFVGAARLAEAIQSRTDQAASLDHILLTAHETLTHSPVEKYPYPL